MQFMRFGGQFSKYIEQMDTWRPIQLFVGPRLRNLVFPISSVARLEAHYAHFDTLALWVPFLPTPRLGVYAFVPIVSHA